MQQLAPSSRSAAKAFGIAVLYAGLICAECSEAIAQQYWNTTQTSGTLNAAVWGTSPSGPFNTAWASGTAVFTANSSITGATVTVKGITVTGSSTVTWTGNGTLNTGSTMAILDVGPGSALNMTGQTITGVTTGNATGFIKNGAGTWSLTNTIGSGAMRLGLTLNAGRLVTNQANNLGSGPLTINGGTWEATGNSTYTPTSMTIGGDFTLEGTGNNAFAAASVGISLGNATRTITNNAGGTGVYRSLLGVISGNAGVGLTFSGTGNSFLGNGANTFTGPLTVTGGDVFFNGDGALGAGTSIVLDGGRITSGSVAAGGTPGPNALTSASIAASKTISIGSTPGTAIGVQGSTGVLTFDGVIADKAGSTGSWAKAGSGRLTLGGVSTYTGSTAITNGTLQLQSGNNRLPTTTVVSLGQASSANLGSLDLNGNSQQIAGLASVAGSNVGASTNTVTSANAATLTINAASGTFTYSAGSAADSGVITGAISVVKNGNGTQILGGSNSYTGSTTVNAGVLRINGLLTGNGGVTVAGGELNVNGSLGTSAVTLDGGVLSGAGTTGAVTVNAGATLSPGNSPGTLTTGAVTFEGGGSYNWQLFDANGSAGTGWDFINSSGALTVNATTGNPFNLNLWTLSGTSPDTNGAAINFNAAVNRSWTIGTFAGGITGTSDGWYTITTSATNGTGGFANAFTGGTFSLAASGNNLNLVYTAPSLNNYDYIAGTGDWSTGANWAGGSAPTGPGLSVSFSGAGGTATNDGQLSEVTGITFTGSASGSYVVAGTGLSIGGAGVVNNSPSAQTIQSVLTATAATVVHAAAGSLTLSGGLDNGGFGVILEGANAVSIGVVSGTGALLKIDSGTATLTGPVATHSVSVSAGTLALAAADLLSDSAAVTLSGFGTLDLGAATDTVHSLTTSGNVTLTNGTLVATTYALGGGSVSANLGGGTLRNTGATALNGTSAAGSINLDAGTLTLGSSGRLTGSPTVTGSSEATLVLGGDETIGALTGAAAVNLGGATLTVGGDNSSTTYSGTMTGGGGVVKKGAGTLTFSGSAAYTGPTVVNEGAVAFSGAASRTVSSSISGSGAVVKSGAGTLTLSGTNTYAGGTAITEGIVWVAAAANLTTTGSINVSGGAALRLNGSGTFGGVGQQLVLSATQAANPIINLASGQTATFLGDVVLASGTNRIDPTATTAALTLAGNITGAGTLWKRATGTLTLSGTANTLSGGVILGTGRLVVAAGSGLGSGSLVIDATSGTATLQLDESVSVGNFSSTTANSAAVTIAAGKTLAVTQSASGTFFGTLSGAGSLTKQGAAALTLSGSSSYAGGTTLSAGSLIAGNASAFGTGMITISGGTLDLGSLAVSNSITNNGGSIIGAGAYAGTQAVATGSTSFSGNVGGSVVVGSGGVAMFSGTVASLTVNTGGQALLGNGAALVQAALINDGVLAVSQAGTMTLASAISGAGSLQQSGLGVTTLTGSNAYVGPTSVDAGGLLVNGANTGLGLVTVANAAWIGGSGSLAGGLSLAAGARLVFDPLSSLSVAGSVTLDNSFGVASLVEADGSAIDWGAIADGTYTLIGTSSTFNTITNFGAENALSIGAGRTAYFENGSLQLVVVPEPSALALAGFGAALAGYAARRRRAG